jgi:hypothetical protein
VERKLRFAEIWLIDGSFFDVTAVTHWCWARRGSSERKNLALTGSEC